MKKITMMLLALATLFFNACAVDDEAEELLSEYDPLTNRFARAWVGADNLVIEVPGADNAGRLAAGKFSALITAVGVQSEFYTMTYDMSNSVNGQIHDTLNLIDEIISNPPSTLTATEAIWGPGSDPLEPFVAMFTMTLTGDDSYEFALTAAPKESDRGEGDYIVVLDGTISEVTDARKSQGTMTWYVDELEVINPAASEAAGSLIVAYDLTDSPTMIEVEFVDFNSGDGTMAEPLDADYYYEQDEDGNGLFSFATTGDIIDSSGEAESVALISRWNADGAGRGDAIISSGDLQTVLFGTDYFYNVSIRASECWGEQFSTAYTIEEIYNGDELLDSTEYGDAAQCAFDTPLFELE